MKQTAVQFYAIETGKLEIERAKGFLTFTQMFDKMLGILNEAKAMEKEQMLDIYINHNQYNDNFLGFDDYYNKTFKLNK
jgi:hypothetical protein